MKKILVLCIVFLSCSEDVKLYKGSGEYIDKYIIHSKSHYYVGDNLIDIVQDDESNILPTIRMKKYSDNADKVVFTMKKAYGLKDIQDGRFTPNKEYFLGYLAIEARSEETIEFIIDKELPEGAIIGQLELWCESFDKTGTKREKFYDYFDVLNE